MRSRPSPRRVAAAPCARLGDPGTGQPDQWHLHDAFGVQVWKEAGRAGQSSMVLDESDLEERLDLLTSADIHNEGIGDVTSSRILAITDRDSNRIVFAGPRMNRPAHADTHRIASPVGVRLRPVATLES